MRELGDAFELYYTGGELAGKDKPAMPPNMHDVGRLGTDGMASQMRLADALILPSRSEGFGMVVAEAMMSGVPVIATCVSALPELVADGVTGTLCPCNDIDAFAEAARKLASDPDLAARMSAAASVMARSRFAVDAMVDSYLGIYARVL